jgi:glycosyltransferase involved in cell wall biosynthesis
LSRSDAKRDDDIPAVRDAAIAAFDERYGSELTLPPVMAIIAALNEEQSIGAVLEALPDTACGLPLGAIVIDDGSTDDTAKIVEKYQNVHLAQLARNCGQGVAMRLGYSLAARHGSQIVVTLDADLQWDPAEIPTVVAPIVAEEADYVTGSRALGGNESNDAVRNAGVVFFARVVSALTGTKITDTSSGLKAMRVEVTQTVTQRQAQYQNAELLIGAIFAGFRITERPITMHTRLAGQSKKGGNALYAVSYARVIATSWWRERRNRARRRT